LPAHERDDGAHEPVGTEQVDLNGARAWSKSPPNTVAGAETSGTPVRSYGSRITPALTTSTSARPNSSSIFRAKHCTDWSLVTSSDAAEAASPPPSNAAATVSPPFPSAPPTTT